MDDSFTISVPTIDRILGESSCPVYVILVQEERPGVELVELDDAPVEVDDPLGAGFELVVLGRRHPPS